MAASTNIHGFNIGGNNNSFDQRGHFYRGVFSGNVSGMLVKQNTTPNMTVLVEHGSALLDKNTISASVAEIKSDTSVTIDTANTSNPRIDTVVIYEDTSVAIPTVEANYWQDGAGGRFKIVSLPGTAGAVPVALNDASIQTAIGAGKPWTRLANITVPANSTTIINSNIADRRVKLSSVIADASVTMPKINNPYKFRVSRNAAANTGNGTFATIAFDTEQYDTNNNFAAGVYTVPVTGYYHFDWNVNVTLTGAVEQVIASLFYDNVEYSTGQRTNFATAAGSGGSDTIYCVAGKVVDIRVYAPVARALIVGGTKETRFSGYLVSVA